MNESKTISILIISSLIFTLVGVLLLWQQGWLTVTDILESSNNKINQFSFWKLIPELVGFQGEKTYLLLFQNNLELRPSGGYLGTFGIAKIKNAQMVSFEIHDTNIFDGFGKVQTDPPQALKDYLKIANWQMRDGNWSPDFPTAAQQVEYFYHLQGGQEEFDGIIAINATILPSLLALTGPIYLEEFDKQFKAEDVLYQIEYEVEKGYWERGIDPGERKTIFKALIKKIVKQLLEKNFWEQKELKDLVIRELDRKNILVFLKDANNQEVFSKLNWSGEINKSYVHDYLMLVEANLAAKKSNYYIKREVEYSIDLSKKRPEVDLKIKYFHQGKQKDWFNDDYRTYLRIYLPYGSYLLKATGVEDETRFLDELNKTVFGNWIIVPTGQEKIIEFNYLLPESIKDESEYKILVQKQSGIDNLPFRIILKGINQKEYIKEKVIEKDWEGIISF
jgi:hypothetical protein